MTAKQSFASSDGIIEKLVVSTTSEEISGSETPASPPWKLTSYTQTGASLALSSSGRASERKMAGRSTCSRIKDSIRLLEGARSVGVTLERQWAGHSTRRKIELVTLSAGLLASSFVGLRILTSDGFLWSAAPTHAYGLIGFVAFDIVLALSLWLFTKLSALSAAALTVIQFAAMAGDLFVGSPIGVPAAVFRTYLFNDGYFMTLLYMQPLIAVLAAWIIRKDLLGFLGKHRGYQLQSRIAGNTFVESV